MSLDQRIARLREATTCNGASTRPAILEREAFSRRDVIDVTGIAGHQLHNWVARNWLTLSGTQNPGKGRKRLYTGYDVINVAFGLELRPFGMMQVADQLSRTKQTSRRAYSMLLNPSFQAGRVLAILPSSDRTGWSYVLYGPETARSGHDFRAAVIIDVDRLILDTLERLLLLQRGERLAPQQAPEGDQFRWSAELVGDDFGDEYLYKTNVY